MLKKVLDKAFWMLPAQIAAGLILNDVVRLVASAVMRAIGK